MLNRSDYLQLGKTLAEALKQVYDKVYIGMKITELCDLVENYIKRHGYGLAFPCNVSVNDIAAHDTADLNDKRIIKEGSVVKIDAGAHLDGYIVDAAVTISFNPKYSQLVRAAYTALRDAVNMMRPGVKIGDIGGIIEKTIKSFGYKPIRNLSGHLLSRYVLHAGKSIPNVKVILDSKIKEGEVYAIEPFATDGIGEVRETSYERIYSLKAKPKKFKHRLLERIWHERRSLPFALRWYFKRHPDAPKALKELVKRGIAFSYPVLVERGGGIVSQFEYTVLIERDGAEILTPIEIE